MRKLLLIGAAVWAISLTGCDLYFGPGDGGPCNWGECRDDGWDEPLPPPGTPGGFCDVDRDCASGCFCAADDRGDSYCEESGFCSRDDECGQGFTCDESRATCIPEETRDNCFDTGCPDGMYCQDDGQCISAPTCTNNVDCDPGFECAPDGSCVPTTPQMECEANADCFVSCYCSDEGWCEESGFCDSNDDCEDGMVCDDRNTCVPGEPPPPPPPSYTCGGPLDATCTVAAPVCPAGEKAETADGCYTQACVPEEFCSDLPLTECNRIQNPNQCSNRPDCEMLPSTWTGENCTDPDGLDCDANDANCMCETWTENPGECVSVGTEP